MNAALIAEFFQGTNMESDAALSRAHSVEGSTSVANVIQMTWDTTNSRQSSGTGRSPESKNAASTASMPD